VVVIAGPNGSGKSTAAPRLLQEGLAVSEFVNADAVAIGLSAFRPETAAVAAGRVMLARLKVLASMRVDFAFETTLASRSFAPWLGRLRETGYHVHIAFVSLPDPQLAVERVASRVRAGGHDVPVEVILRRYRAGLYNFFERYAPAADTWQMFDNSGPMESRLVARRSTGGTVQILDSQAWENLQRRAR
jgi:predicted ABC-type ATPase